MLSNAKLSLFFIDHQLFKILKWAQNWAALKKSKSFERKRKVLEKLSASAVNNFERTKALQMEFVLKKIEYFSKHSQFIGSILIWSQKSDS